MEKESSRIPITNHRMDSEVSYIVWIWSEIAGLSYVNLSPEWEQTHGR